MKTIILASNNKHKLEEVRRIMNDYKVLSLEDIGFTEEIIENGKTFKDNALIKAKTVMKYMLEKTDLNYAIVAEDSGLCVRAINFEPGVYSARYSGKGDEGNRQKLLEKLLTIQDRTAYFICSAVVMFPTGHYFTEEGKTFGQITKTKIGDESFGYDCIFWSDKLRKTFGQATQEEKDSVSHRGMAFKNIKERLDSDDYMSDEE